MHISPESLFAALTNSTRLRCLLLLLEHGELCVCELTQALEAAQPNVSRHLAHLREAGLVVDRRQGLWIFYRLHPDLPEWVLQVLRTTASGVGSTSPYAEDRARLRRMPTRPDTARCA